MKFAWRILPLFFVVATAFAGYTAGVQTTEAAYKPRLAALNKQIDVLVEMQNMDKDAYELSTAYLQARIRQYMESGCK